MQFVELKIDASSESSPCWLRHSKVILVYYFTCIIVIYHVKFLPFFFEANLCVFLYAEFVSNVHFFLKLKIYQGFPSSSVGKESACP